MSNDPIIIIGTGLAGYNLAKEIRKLDANVPLCLFTEDDGAFYSKPQLSASLAKGKLADDLPLSNVVKMREQLSADIHTYSTVTAVDATTQTVHVGEKAYHYRACVFANGASVLPLPFACDDAGALLRVNNLEDYRRFQTILSGKKRIAIIGAGLVGTEFAVDLTSAGFTVDVVAMGATPLDRFMPAECGAVVQQALADKGITWHMNAMVDQVEKTAEGFAIHTAQQTLNADAVLVAIGIKPNIDVATAAGLKVNKGIVTDEFCQTSINHIYALGDCAEMNGVVRNYTLPAFQSAKALAKTLAGDKTAVVLPTMPIIAKTPWHPIVMVLPEQTSGEWTVQVAQASGSKAICQQNDNVIGFILTGSFASERADMLRLLHNN